MLLIFVFRPEPLAKKIPEALIHGVQFSLGLLLIRQATQTLSHENALGWIFAFGSVFVLMLITMRSAAPVLGLVATIGFFFGLQINELPKIEVAHGIFEIRMVMVLSLVIPQLVLTSANAVLATVNVSQHWPDH